MSNKKKIRIQFQAIHAGASKEAFIAIDNIQFSNDCRSHPSRKKSPRPNNRQNNKSKGENLHLLSGLLKVFNHKMTIFVQNKTILREQKVLKNSVEKLYV